MSKRRKRNQGITFGLFRDLFILIGLLIYYVFYLLFIIFGFIFRYISYRKSGYKEKSGFKYLATRYDRGVRGEYKLYRLCIKLFGKDNVLTNIYLPCTTIDTTEVDVLVISTKGIYCLEMKNYKGYIYGSSNDTYWTQVLNGSTHNTFYSPVLQNRGHAKALASALNISIDKIDQVTIFGNKANINNVNCDDIVLSMKDARVYLANSSDHEDIFTLEEVINYQTILGECTHVSEDAKNEHIDQINEEYK